MDRFLIRNNKKPNDGLGFSATKSDPVNAQCVLCGQVLANSSMKPAHMNRHLSTVHPSHVGKPIEFFKRKQEAFASNCLEIAKVASVSSKALRASYAVSYLVVKQKKPHTITECLILPALVKVSEIIRIEDIASDIVMQVIEQIKLTKMFALQLDESTDVSGESQVIVFVRYQDCSDIRENILFCQNLQSRTTGEELFKRRIMDHGLDKEEKSKVKWLHCIIHRQALASKRMNAHLHETLNEAVKVINFIKARPLNSRMFKLLCQEMGSEHQHLLLHTEVRWLSRGKILNRLFELRQEVHMFLLEQKSAF
ncbi:hypothetical protein QYM36_007954, partial [Artemia franciscana]